MITLGELATARLIEVVSKPSNRIDQRAIESLSTTLIFRHSEQSLKTLSNALLDALPPAKADQDLQLRLQVLGVSLAFGVVILSVPSMDLNEARQELIRQARNNVNHLRIELTRRGAIVHIEFAEVFEDRLRTLLFLPLMAHWLLRGDTSKCKNDAVFVQHLLLAGTFKASLRDALLHHYLKARSSAERRRFSERALEGLQFGINYPWEPELDVSARAKGWDILIHEALPRAEPFRINSLLSILQLPHSGFEKDESVGFLSGLIENNYFKRSAKAAQSSWPAMRN